MNDKVSIYISTFGLWNTYAAILPPKDIKTIVDISPNAKVPTIHILDMCFIFAILLLASEIVGISKTAIELIIVDGNNTKGIAIPVNIPYIDKASLELKPYFFSITGINIVSSLWSIVITSLLAVSGVETLIIGKSTF